MRIPTVLAVAASVLGADAINYLDRRDGSPPHVVQHQIQRKRVANPVQRDRERMRKRADSDYVSASLANEETLYLMNLTIGTPAQSFELHIDTGSSDLWVNVANSTLCEEKDSDCSATGTYSANDSSTYTYINSDFNITYADDSGAAGDYVSDVVAFDGVTLDGQEFGIGYTSSSDIGVLGIGYMINEASVTTGQTYANLPYKLMLDGYINSNAYSLWLNDLDSSTGTILFGGVNTDRFSGELKTIPIVKEAGVYAEFIIALTGVGANGTDGSIASDIAYPALLDSGTSLIYLPDDMCTVIYDAVGATYDSNAGVATVDCSLADVDWTLDFTFSSPTISVAMRELVLVYEEEQNEEICIIGVSPAGDSTPVLGDTFLRSAYVVYDMTSNEISIAQTVFNSTTDNILEITNSTGVPDSTAVSNPVTTVDSDAGTVSAISTITEGSFALPTAAPVYNLAVLGAAGAGLVFAAL